MRRMAQQCLFLLLILTITTRIHSQLDSQGFLSIDCGFSGATTYIEHLNNLTYVSDDNFIDTGLTSNISSSYISDNQFREYQTVRYFPIGTRNCYTIKPLTAGLNYLIRAIFYYANYDGLNRSPTFDIYLGVTDWNTVNATSDFFHEIIFTATADFVQVCLLNKDQGIPFISSLHLRQFQSGMYSYVNSLTSLIRVTRKNFGGSNYITRYPDDTYDRWWLNDTFSNAWIDISTSSEVNYADPTFKVPPVVMQTAATTSSTEQPLSFNWSGNKSTKYYFLLYFYEIQTPSTGRREFDIFVNGNKFFDTPIVPSMRPWLWVYYEMSDNTYYNVSLVATPNSTLPPMLNAFELYTVATVSISTYAKDVAAINSVKEFHRIKKGWNGDPCFPIQLLWTGISCNTDISNNTRITSLNLSSSLLTGSLSNAIGNLTALQHLYLSNNTLSGSLPRSLDSLTSLKLLDIRSNPKFSTILPPELESKRRSGYLEFRYGEIISSPSPAKNRIIIAVAVAVPSLLIAVAITVITVLKRKKYKRSIVQRQNEVYPPITIGKSYKYSYSDLKRITNNFKDKIGTGGYGSVFLGHLENGLRVAVKQLSQSSTQGYKEFLAEAENLSRVHHKNLVLLMGYCTDKNCMALVYEYMQEGNLHDKLKATPDNPTRLSWKQRLQIAYESAQGLEYLHTCCNPPLIHRDVKTSNILLNANLEAKIADFGLSRSFDNNMVSRVSTRVVGTIGYLDPEYYLSNQLSTKSDVFSFGVVLLEMITGRPPIISGIESGSLIQWVRHRLSKGGVESIVDPKIQNEYDFYSLWKVVNLASTCTEPTSSKRPTMSAIVAELKESLDLEMSMVETRMEQIYSFQTDTSQNSNIEMAHMGGIQMMGPNIR